MSRTDVSFRWLTAAVWGHFLVSLVHGRAHAGAQVPLSTAANLFVLLVIVAGPLIGWAVARRSYRAGCWMVALTLGGSLVFGVLNHFVLGSPDHVMHVHREWRMLFAITAVLLALTETVGLGVALRRVREGKSR